MVKLEVILVQVGRGKGGSKRGRSWEPESRWPRAKQGAGGGCALHSGQGERAKSWFRSNTLNEIFHSDVLSS